MKSHMNFLGMFLLSFPITVKVFPVPVGPTHNTLSSFVSKLPISSALRTLSTVGISISKTKKTFSVANICKGKRVPTDAFANLFREYNFAPSLPLIKGKPAAFLSTLISPNLPKIFSNTVAENRDGNRQHLKTPPRNWGKCNKAADFRYAALTRAHDKTPRKSPRCATGCFRFEALFAPSSRMNFRWTYRNISYLLWSCSQQYCPSSHATRAGPVPRRL